MPTTLRHAVIVLAMPIVVRAAFGQPAEPSWQSWGASSGVGNQVRSIANWDPDGAGPLPAQLVIGGVFTSAGGQTVDRIARWDGSAWQSFGTGMNANVFTVATWDPDGAGPLPAQLVAGGEFMLAGGSWSNHIGGTTVNRIARWDGSAWQPFGTGMNANVSTIATWDPDGDGPLSAQLVAGGDFTTAGGVMVNRIARWDGETWQPFGTGMDTSVSAVATWDPDGAGPLAAQLVAGGLFTTASGVTVNRIARWDGVAWQSLGTGIAGGEVYAMSTWDPDGAGPLSPQLIVGGSFTIAGGMPARGIARWDGTTWQPFGAGISGSVYALSTGDPDGSGPLAAQLVAGGFFSTAGGVTVNHVTRWDGAAWRPFGTGMNDWVFAITIGDPDGAGPLASQLIVGGQFTTPGVRVARWDGSAWQRIGTGMNDSVITVATWDPDGAGPLSPQLIAGGSFTTAGGMPARRVARWDGTTWQTFGTGMNDSVAAVATWDPDGAGPISPQLIAGGSFTTASGMPASRIARWDGTTWQTLGTGMDSWVGALTSWDPDGSGQMPPKLVAAGNFTTAGGVTVNRIASWDGAAWQPLGTGMDGPVVALSTWDPDGAGPISPQLIAGGRFTTAGGTPASSIARWDGAMWQPLGIGMNDSVNALATWDLDGSGPALPQLIGGGYFTTAGGTPVSRVARWDGATWQSCSRPSHSGELDVSNITTWDEDGTGPTAAQLVVESRIINPSGTYRALVQRWDGSVWQQMSWTEDTSLYALGTWDPDGLGPRPDQLVAGGYLHLTPMNSSSWGYLATWSTRSPLNQGPATRPWDLEVLSASVSPATAAPGDSVSVTYTVRNNGSQEAGSWTDIVRLSRALLPGNTDYFPGSAIRAEPLAPGTTRAFTIQVVVPAEVGPLNVFVQSSSGPPDQAPGNDTIRASLPLVVQLPVLNVGGSANLTLAPFQRAWFRMPTPMEATIEVSGSANGAAPALRLGATFGHTPAIAGEADVADAAGQSISRSLRVPASGGDSWFIVAESASLQPQNVTISATARPAQIVGVNRRQLPTAGESTLSMDTFSIPENAVAELVSTAGSGTPAEVTDVRDGTRVRATFNLRSALPPGGYALRFRAASGLVIAQLPGLIDVIESNDAAAGLWANLSGPSNVRIGREFAISAWYRNDALTDVVGGWLTLRRNGVVVARTPAQSQEAEGLRFLPQSEAGFATRQRVPALGPVTFTLSSSVPGNQPFDWDWYAANPPVGFPADSWATVVNRHRGTVGPTWDHVLSAVRPYLGGVGSPDTADLGRALAFHVQYAMERPRFRPGPTVPPRGDRDGCPSVCMLSYPPAPGTPDMGVMVFTHGWNSSVEGDEAYAQYVSATTQAARSRGYQVITVDWPEPANTTFPKAAGLLAREVGATVGRSLSQMGIEASSVTWQGHSFGNIVGMFAALGMGSEFKRHIAMNPPSVLGSGITWEPLATESLSIRAAPLHGALADQLALTTDERGRIRIDLYNRDHLFTLSGHGSGYETLHNLLQSDPNRFWGLVELTDPSARWLFRRADGSHGDIDALTGTISGNLPVGSLVEFPLPYVPETLLARLSLIARRSTDPNDILGPTGSGAERWIAPGTTMDYTVRFENLAGATSAAQEVFITQALDQYLDLSTFRFGDYGLSGRTYSVSGNGTAISALLDLRSAGGVMVEVEGSLHVPGRVVQWTFRAVDPSVGGLPEDPSLGVLPPNSAPPIGEGYVTYSVAQNPGLPTGSRIDAQARIVFDTNAPIDTPTWRNTIDADGPIVTLNPVSMASGGSISVSWAAGPPTGGAGLERVVLYASENSGPMLPVASADAAVSTLSFTGRGLSTYDLMVRGFDGAGNISPPPPQPSPPLPRTTVVDVNNSGLVSVQDVFDFLSLWFAQDPRADIDRSGLVATQDVFTFLTLFFSLS